MMRVREQQRQYGDSRSDKLLEQEQGWGREITMADASEVTYTQAGTDPQTRTVEESLREVISLADFLA